MKNIGLVWVGLLLVVLYSAVCSDPIGNDIGSYNLFSPAARTTVVGTYTSPVYDRSGFRSAVGVWQSAASSAGSACSAYVSLQESNEAAVGGGLNNMTATTADSVGLRNVEDSTNIKIAFTVTQDSARTINSVTLRMRKVGSPTVTNNVTLTINTNNSGAPSGTAVQSDATDTVLISSIGSTWTWVTFTFDRPVDLAASTVYHYVLSGNYTISTTAYIQVMVETVGSGGDFTSQGPASAWTASTTKDIVGRILRYNFSTITGAAFDTATHTVGKFSTVDVDLRSKKRYVRAKATIVGSSGSFVSSGALILGEALNKPVSD